MAKKTNEAKPVKDEKKEKKGPVYVDISHMKCCPFCKRTSLYQMPDEKSKGIIRCGECEQGYKIDMNIGD